MNHPSSCNIWTWAEVAVIGWGYIVDPSQLCLCSFLPAPARKVDNEQEPILV